MPSLVILNPIQKHIILTKSFKKTLLLKQSFKLFYVNMFIACPCNGTSQILPQLHLPRSRAKRRNPTFFQSNDFEEESQTKVRVEYVFDSKILSKLTVNTLGFKSLGRNDLSFSRRHSEILPSLPQLATPQTSIELWDFGPDFLAKNKQQVGPILWRLMNFSFRIKFNNLNI